MSSVPPLIPKGPSLSPTPQGRSESDTRTFGLRWWAWAVFLLAAVVMVLAVLRAVPDGASPRERGRMVGECVGEGLGLLLIPGLFSLLAFYGGRRSRTSASVTFVVLLALMEPSMAFKRLAPIRQEQKAALAALAQATDTAQSEMRQRIARGEQMADPAAVSRVAAAADKAADAARGDDAGCLRAGAAVLRRINEAGQAHAQAVDKVGQHSLLTPSWVRTQADLATARQGVQDFLKANGRLRDVIKNFDSIVDEELKKNQVGEAAAKRFVVSGTKRIHDASPLMCKLRDVHDELGAALLGACDLLEKEWGRWSCEAADKTVLFQNPLAAEEFNTLNAKVNELVATESTLQQQRALQLSK